MATQEFLPSGCNIVVRTPSGNTVWHVIREEIPVTGHRAARCPRTDVPVRTAYHQSYPIWFPADLVRTREVPDEKHVDRKVLDNLGACLLYYDIPTRAEVDNPSNVLRRFAVRVNLSCWIIREADIPYALMHRLSEAGVSWNTVPFDPKAGDRIMRTVLEALRTEVGDAIQRSQEAHAAADVQLAGAEDTDKAEERYLRRAEGITKRFKQLREDLEAAASNFGINPAALQFETAQAAVDQIGVAMHERARIYLESIRTIREATEGREIFSETTHPNLLIDRLLELEKHDEAETLREAFTPEEEEALSAKAGEDGSFRLWP
jgi:hypothetical protein